MLNLEWLLDHADTVKNVITSTLSDETAEDIEEMKRLVTEGSDETVAFVERMTGLVGKGIDIALDILREPLQEAGYELEMTRAISSREAEEVKARLLRIKDGTEGVEGM